MGGFLSVLFGSEKYPDILKRSSGEELQKIVKQAMYAETSKKPISYQTVDGEHFDVVPSGSKTSAIAGGSE